MNVKVEVECTPAEARAFLGLPDVGSLNDHLVKEMKARMDTNMAMIAPEELIKTWMAFGGEASQQFMKLMVSGSVFGRKERMNDTIFALATAPCTFRCGGRSPHGSEGGTGFVGARREADQSARGMSASGARPDPPGR